ncbi:MAG TPA: tetratricopeptide repeat protein [Bryobacteraceae bacterium]|jgi:tetratricopeptide (TPR) repeat protein|nr:tetratricopeptide repeat protein [Bryobacteraceae bacterium]
MIARVAFCVMLAVSGFAQSSDVFERLKHALAPYGEGEAAAQELAKEHFATVEAMLAKGAALDTPDRAELVSLEGAVAFLARDMKQAITFFGKAAAVAPLKDGDSFTLAMALVVTGEDQRASGILLTLAQKHPRQAIYLYWLGRIDYNLRLYPEAIDKLRKVVELDPKSARAWDSLGLAFDMQGQMEQAYEALKKAEELNRARPYPSAWPPHDLGCWYLRMNQPQEAENVLRESLRFDPKFAPAHYHLGRALEKQGRDGEAVLEYKTAISEDTFSTDACYSLASLYRKLRRNAEANAMFAEYRKRKEVPPSADVTPLRDPQ